MTTKYTGTVRKLTEEELRKLCGFLDALRDKEADVIARTIMRSRSYPSLGKFLKITRRFRDKFLSRLKESGLSYDDFLPAMAEYEKREREKTGRSFTNATLQLIWVRRVVGGERRGD